MTEKMHKIAIVKFVGEYTSYDDYDDNIVRSITDWELVDEDTFDLLKKASTYLYGNIADHGDTRFHVIEFLNTKSTDVVKTVDAYVEMVRKQKEATELEAKKRAEKAAEKKRKAAMTETEKKRELYLQLQKEFGDTKT